LAFAAATAITTTKDIVAAPINSKTLSQRPKWRTITPATRETGDNQGGFPMKKLATLAALAALAGPVLAQDAMKVTVVTPEALVWKDNPNIPKGGQVALLIGDPTKAGEVVVQRVKLPPNYKVPPHTHPYAETVTLISGSVGFGMGEKFDDKGALAKPGTLFANPAKHAHYVWTGPEEAIIQVQFVGPGGIEYINPADDPRKTQ
jgi:quercetin dioxygenase-like cupin family protein